MDCEIIYLVSLKIKPFKNFINIFLPNSLPTQKVYNLLHVCDHFHKHKLKQRLF